MKSLNAYYADNLKIALTSSFVEQNYIFNSISIMLSNDEPIVGGKNIYLSWDGINVHMTVKPGEMLAIDFKGAQSIWLKGEAGSEEYRALVW